MVSKVVVVPLVVVSECLLQNELLHQAKLELMAVVLFVFSSIVLLEVLMKKLSELAVLLVGFVVEAMVPEELQMNKKAWKVQMVVVLHDGLEKMVVLLIQNFLVVMQVV